MTVKASTTSLKGLYNLLKKGPSDLLKRYLRISRTLGANSGHKGLYNLLKKGLYAHPEHWGVK
jgi:hypothetical protein